jgi:uncharacterized protein
MTPELIKRDISITLDQCINSFPVTVLTGPRQSGKTTLLRSKYPDYQYISLESPDNLLRVKQDPHGLLDHIQGKGLIIDEAQQYPELFSYIQTKVDEPDFHLPIVISGSQNFLLLDTVSQSLAGRAAILELLPLSLNEIAASSSTHIKLNDFLYHGGYPRPYTEKLDRKIWFNSYIKTYIERDVRALINIKDLAKFQLFLQLCAGRHGQLLNMSALSIECGISHTTVNEWISLLEASYIIYRLRPFHKNFNKRVTKSAKLYFYDSGLVCHLLGIDTTETLRLHPYRGAIFEGAIITEFVKRYFSTGQKAPLYFWRDSAGHEVDLLVESGGTLKSYEIKSGETYRPELLKGLKKWQKISGDQRCYLIYAGKESFIVNNIQIESWLSALSQSS